MSPTEPGISPGERVAQLPGFWPDAASLKAFLEGQHREELLDDPAMALLYLQESALDRRPVLAKVIESLRHSDTPWIDWRLPAILPIYRTALAAAQYARLLAERTEKHHPDMAWAAAWLPFLPWLGMSALAPQAVVDCLTHSAMSRDPVGAQIRVWGLSRADIAGRLAHHWPMPAKAKSLLQRLDISPAEAERHGANADLLAIVQLAVWLAELSESRLGLTYEFVPELAAEHLELHAGDISELRAYFLADVDLGRLYHREWIDPRGNVALLDSIRANASPTIRLHHPVELIDEETDTAVSEIDTQIRDAKLVALAEFAAGASHEINTPLAVISGHSQLLLKSEIDPDKRHALETIIRQTNKIHSVLTDLMQYARPSKPDLQPVEMRRLIESCIDSLQSEALARGISIDYLEHTAPLWVNGDIRQLKIAVKALLRNALEAVATDGWVTVKTQFRSDTIDLIVEDSGPGPDEAIRPYLFDPFFSGHVAGRGRGLGLPTAWRLAREHGGNALYVPLPNGPTRFVIKLPALQAHSLSERRTA